jgi:hypothetical protein
MTLRRWFSPGAGRATSFSPDVLRELAALVFVPLLNIGLLFDAADNASDQSDEAQEYDKRGQHALSCRAIK